VDHPLDVPQRGDEALERAFVGKFGMRVEELQRLQTSGLLAPMIAEIRASGITKPYSIAAALTARRIPTPRGHRLWTAGTVSGIVERLDRLARAEKSPAGAGPTP